MFKRRIKELEVGEFFKFSGLWRKVLKKDAEFLRYGTESGESGWKTYQNDTIMVNSLMIVETKD